MVLESRPTDNPTAHSNLYILAGHENSYWPQGIMGQKHYMPICNVPRAFSFMWPRWDGHVSEEPQICCCWTAESTEEHLNGYKDLRVEKRRAVTTWYTTVLQYALSPLPVLEALFWFGLALSNFNLFLTWNTHKHMLFVCFWQLLTFDANHTSAWRHVFNSCTYRHSNKS